MDLKSNINRIHLLLSDNFKEVIINEKSSLKFGNYFEIVVKEGLEVKMILPYKNIDNKIEIPWLYYSNPLDEKSLLIERVSNINSIVNNINDIISKKRFSEEYLNLIAS